MNGFGYRAISRLPVIVAEIPQGARGVHESVLRAYQILERVKYLLSKNTHPEIVLELIKLMEENDLQAAFREAAKVPLTCSPERLEENGTAAHLRTQLELVASAMSAYGFPGPE